MLNKTKKKKYKAAVIGCGKIGIEVASYNKVIQPVTHAGGYQDNPRVELVALVDINKERLNIAKRYFPDVLLFSSAEKMFLEIGPDIVSVATNPETHFQLVKLAARFKTPAILCEKPIAESKREAEEMIKTCRNNGSLLFIHYQRRFDSLLRKWRERIKNGLIGKVIQGHCYYYNGLFNNGSHNVDLFRFFLGEPDWAMGLKNKKTSWKEGDGDVDTLIHFKNGARVVMQALPKNYGLVEYHFYGTKGHFAVKKGGYEVEHRKLTENKYFKGYFQLSEKIKKEGGMRSFMRPVVSNIVSCLDGKGEPLSRGEDGLASLNILSALRESAKQGGKIIKFR